MMMPSINYKTVVMALLAMIMIRIINDEKDFNDGKNDMDKKLDNTVMLLMTMMMRVYY